MRSLILALGVLLIFNHCSKPKQENLTNKFLPGKRLAELTNKKLKEVSGLAASISNPGLLWAHNDSGNGPDIFLIDENLNIKLRCKIDKIENRDWEDITVGPGPDAHKSYVYIGEIGDNNAIYKFKHIYRFEEPVWQKDTDVITITDFDTITFELPDKKKDSEALWIDHQTKDIFIVSKREEPVFIYQLKYPQAINDTITASKILSLPLTQIVAAALSPDGKSMVMKNYEHIYYWQASDSTSIVEALKQKPFEVPYEIEPQGESITWRPDGQGFYTISEKNLGKKSFLYLYETKK